MFNNEGKATTFYMPGINPAYYHIIWSPNTRKFYLLPTSPNWYLNEHGFLNPGTPSHLYECDEYDMDIRLTKYSKRINQDNILDFYIDIINAVIRKIRYFTRK
jgi:hypothetical protein